MDYIYTVDKGLLPFKTNYIDKTNIFNASDIEEKTTFLATLSSYCIYTTINCRLWKPLNETMWVFCKLNKSLYSYDIIIKDVVFHYKEHTIGVIFNYYRFSVKILNVPVPFLYSEKQIINLKEEIDSYDLKFHIMSYNAQPLYLSSDEDKKILLEDCKENGKDLICNIKKEKFYEICTNSSQKLKVYPYDYSLNMIKFNAILDIIINFDNIQKEDVFINITKLLDNNVYFYNFIAYETNITNISDINSEPFILSFRGNGYLEELSCRFKKSIKTPLLIVCFMSRRLADHLDEIKNEIILNNISIKYNFRIQPVNNKEKYFVNIRLAAIKSYYPIVLNYYLYDSINIDFSCYWYDYLYIMPNIVLNLDAGNLTCYELRNATQRCVVPKSHFEGKEGGYYLINYFNNDINELKISYQLSPIQVLLPKDNDIIIKIKKENNKNKIRIGQKGALNFITNFIDKKNIFNETYIHFNSTIKDESINEYNVKCLLWISKNENSKIVCRFNENLYNQQKLFLKTMKLTYNNYNIFIFQNEPIEVEQFNYEISFLYNDEQIIEIKDEINSYNLKFYFEVYNNETLYIYGERNNSLFLENCKRNESELNCEILKEKIEEILIKNNEKFKLAAINDTIGIINFYSVLNIIINYKIDKKEDIYFSITDLLSDNDKPIKDIPSIVFETNVTDIPNIISDVYRSCYFKKDKESPLLYLCNFYQYDYFYPYVFSIWERLIIDNSHYKYNFIIDNYLGDDQFYIENYGAKINFIYPEILNFTLEDSLTISYLEANPSEFLENINLDSKSDYLKCENQNGIKKCIVPLNHFKFLESGYYYLNQNQRDLSSSFLHYESSPIKVIIPENILVIYVYDKDNLNNEEKILIGKNNFIFFVTDYIDEKNIFDISDIEEKTYFNTTIESFLGYNKVICRLWKPKKSKIRIFCKIEENIGSIPIKLNSASFNYKNHRIVIISEMSCNYNPIKTRQNIPFLYSNEQEIKMEADKQYYELKFKIEEYNNEVLFLREKKRREDMYFTELILEDCNIEGRNLICKIEKEKIIENLNCENEIFELYFYSSLKGLYKFSCVFDITIVAYNLLYKKNIIVWVTKLIQNNLDFQNYIPYETNITSLSNLISDFFYYNTSNGLYTCRFIKSANKPLLFLCNIKNNKTNSSLGEKKEEVILDNIHIKYNFIIQPVKNSEIFTMKNEGSRLSIIYPTKLDFTKNDLIPIYLIMSKPENTGGIRLNQNSEELVCGHLDDMLKRCLVPKSHFAGKQNGYYFIHYLNRENKLNTFYEVSPILVILQKEDKPITDEPQTDDPKKDDDTKNKKLIAIIVGSSVGGLILIGIIVFFVVRYYKKKKYSNFDLSGKIENILPNSTEVEFNE